MSIHNKQFVIGNQPKKIKEDWKMVKIGEEFYLSYSPELLMGKTKDLNGQEWCLLGIAIQTEKEKNAPLTEIENSFTAGIREVYKSWNGRWVLVGNNEIHTDCTGILGCFYTKINEERWISSSLAILQEIGRFLPRPENLKWKSYYEWYPLPLTRFEGVYKLLPSQILELKTFHPVQRALPQPIEGLLYDEILEKIRDKFKFSFLNLSNLNQRIFVPLTCGKDSRLVLAAAYNAGIEVETYTQEHRHISYYDVKLPSKLAKAAGYRHKYIKKSKFSKKKEELYDLHTAQNTNDADREMFSCGQFDAFGKGDIVLKGGIFEAGRCFYYKKLDSRLNIETILKRFNIVNSPESFRFRAFLDWIKWVDQTPSQGLDWRDRFYIEQRIAGWLSSIEQSLDLTGSERFYVVNCYDILCLLLSIPAEKRRTGQHHIDLIKKMLPDLLQYPFNPPDPALIRQQKKAVKLTEKVIRISKMPLPELYKKLKKKLLF